MITIEKGDSKIICTKLAFEEQFKPLGYHIASENKGAAEKTEAPLLKKEEEKDIKEINKDEEKEKIKAKYGLNKKKK
jgi:hypothetical protein